MVVVLLRGLDDDSRDKLKEEAASTKGHLELASFAIHSVDHSDSESDSGSEASSTSGDYTVEDIVEDLKTDIQCLVDLGPRYKEPIRDRVVVEKAALPPPVANWDPAEHWASRIRHRYPHGDAAFAQFLGQTNWDRAQRLYSWKERNIREAQQPAATAGPAYKPSGTVGASDFQDSGLGTSIVTPSSYAETLLSYHGTNGGSIKIPTIPAEAVEGSQFVCDICGRLCHFPRTNLKSFWKYAWPVLVPSHHLYAMDC